MLGRRAALVSGGAVFLARTAGAETLAAPVLPPPPQGGSSRSGQAGRPTPAAALRTLLEGNRRYANNNVESFDEDTTILRDGTPDGQTVLAAVLTCTDLAEPAELIFDQPVGRIHAVKTPGNVATRDAIGRLEYAVSGLGAVQILVLAHSGCAAIEAAIKAKPEFGKPGPYAAFARAVLQGKSDPVVTAELNALVQVAELTQASRLIAARVADGSVAVTACYFDAGTRGVITGS